MQGNLVMRLRRIAIAGLFGLASAMSLFGAKAMAEPASFLVMGKTSNYRQAGDGDLRLLNHHAFAEIFLNPGEAVSDPHLITPTGRDLPFSGTGAVLEAHGGRYATADDLARAFPDGPYVIRYNGTDRPLSMRADATYRLPPPVTITLRQGGRVVAPAAVRAHQDLTISWSLFTAGAADPNGIVDDLIFVVFGDCAGTKLLHSGAPFTGKPYLTYRARDLVIPAALIAPGQTYQVTVELARVRTARVDGVPVLATLATTSFLDLATDGAALSTRCAPIDKGQTDRYESWREIP